MGAFICSTHHMHGLRSALGAAQGDSCQLSDEVLQEQIEQLRQKLAWMEQCIIDIDAAIQHKELEELQAQAAAAHQTADESMQHLEPPGDGGGAIVLCSETSEAITPSLPTVVSTDSSMQAFGPLSAQTNVQSGRYVSPMRDGVCHRAARHASVPMPEMQCMQCTWRRLEERP